MADNFLAEIRIVGFNFAPNGWAFCNGQILPISQNTALFSLLGTTYGGNGISTFALPNLQGSAPLHFGQGNGLSNYFLGETGGEATVTLAPSQMPQHNHTASANAGNGDVNNPAGNAWARPHLGKTPVNIYNSSVGTASLALSGQALATAGSSLPHNNMPPYLTLNFVIALTGIFPARS
jgi:microcystin-dependent protein